ncbi:MAG: hypothetical protein RLZZ241_415 [Bacteroidota bacterium]|jgi:hypothetical protein
MKRLQFEIIIRATAEAIWESLWSDAGYRNWSAVFAEGSYVESKDWKEGTLVQFLSEKGNGIYSFIAKHEPNKLIIFKHLGAVQSFVNQPATEESAPWCGFREEYSLQANEIETVLTVTLETTKETVSFFQEHFPKALEKIKSRAEN